MSIFDEEPLKPRRVHEVGQDLAKLSVAELTERIEQLKSEIVRLESEVSSKGETKAAAEAFFRQK